MNIDHESHTSAIAMFNSAAMRTVGGSSEGDAQQPTEFGLVLIGAGVPTWLSPYSQHFHDSANMKQRFVAARFLRDLADRIEAKNLLEEKEDAR